MALQWVKQSAPLGWVGNLKNSGVVLYMNDPNSQFHSMSPDPGSMPQGGARSLNLVHL